MADVPPVHTPRAIRLNIEFLKRIAIDDSMERRLAMENKSVPVTCRGRRTRRARRQMGGVRDSKFGFGRRVVLGKSILMPDPLTLARSRSWMPVSEPPAIPSIVSIWPSSVRHHPNRAVCVNRSPNIGKRESARRRCEREEREGLKWKINPSP